jgi:hypothetical protein
MDTALVDGRIRVGRVRIAVVTVDYRNGEVDVEDGDEHASLRVARGAHGAIEDILHHRDEGALTSRRQAAVERAQVEIVTLGSLFACICIIVDEAHRASRRINTELTVVERFVVDVGWRARDESSRV